MKKNKIKNISLLASLAMVANLIFPAFASAYSFSVPYGSLVIDSSQMLSMSDEITQRTETRYGIDQDIWRRAQRKESAPRVEIFFDNTNPKPGEKVTAHAIPQFFKNNPENLYYTWYLIHTKDGSIETATNTISEGKKEAAAIMARGDYDPNLDGQTYEDSNKDPDVDGWPDVDSNSYDENKTAAPMGGADGVGGLAEESVSAYNSADEWCDSLGNHTWDSCSYNDTDNYKPLDTYFTLTSSQTNHYCNLCEDYFSGDGAAAYASAKTARNNCCYTNTPESSLQCSSVDPVTMETTYYKCPQDSNIDYCGVTYNPLFEQCYTNFKEANKSTFSACLDAEYTSCETDWAAVHEDFNGDGFSDYSEQDTTSVSRCYKHNFGTNADASIFMENELSGNATNNSSGLDFSTPCKHKWINSPDYKSGSGKFPNGEEKYWKTDPTDPDTDGDGFKDEADIIGLGQQEFTWTYRSGDRLGVVVEGTSMIPVDEKSAYYKIMWGHMDVCDSTKTQLMSDDECDDSSDYGFGFLATESPSEQGDDNLEISLSFSPDNPVADPSDENEENISDDGAIMDADMITVVSSLDNTEYNPNNLYYHWQISKGNPEKDDWTEIKDISENFSTNNPSSGMGISSFSFTPKKSSLSEDSDINYFKVTLTVSLASGLKKGRGRSSVIIPVNTKGIKLTLHKVDIKNGKATIGEEVCDNELHKILCPAVKGQMLAAKISGNRYNNSNSEFSWTINGNPIYPPNDVSDTFDGWSNTAVFFPITKSEQEIETISVTATSKEELQPATSARLVTVVHPAVFIKSADSSLSWPKTYQAESQLQKSTLQNFESAKAFEALAGRTASYYLDFVPYYLLGNDSNSQINWSVNGTDITSVDFYENNPFLGIIELENENKGIKLPISEIEGAFTTLSAEVKKYWSDEERAISYHTWDIAPETLSGDASISIEAVTAASSDELSAGNGVGQILAAVGTHLPHYFMYLLRLALTMVVMFVASSIFYGLTQRLKFTDDEK